MRVFALLNELGLSSIECLRPFVFPGLHELGRSSPALFYARARWMWHFSEPDIDPVCGLKFLFSTIVFLLGTSVQEFERFRKSNDMRHEPFEVLAQFLFGEIKVGL